MMEVGGRFKDQLEQAEEYARVIAKAKDGGRFPHVGVGGRGVLQVFLAELAATRAEVKALREEVERLKRNCVNKYELPEHDSA